MPQQKLENGTKLYKPNFYAVIIFHDEITSISFVVNILNEIFYKTLNDARKLTKEIQINGKAIAGIYTYDIAITKKSQVDTLASENNFPLKIVVEEYDICI